MAGYTLPTNSNQCEPCPVNTYKEITGPGICSTCIGGKTSALGSNNPDNCVCPTGSIESQSTCQLCNEGEYAEEGTCEKCPTGTYNPNKGQDTCTDCPFGETSTEGSSSITNCLCSKGFYHGSGETPCLSCEAGTFKDTIGNSECTTCSESFTSSKDASEEETDCTCKAGYNRIDPDSGCQPCEMGTYKENLGTSMCTTCVSATTYSPFVGAIRCEDCPEHEESAGLTCYCIPGYARQEAGGACIFHVGNQDFAFTATFDVNIAAETVGYFTIPKQVKFLASVSKLLGVALISIRIASIEDRNDTNERRRLLALQSVDVTIEILASEETLATIVQVITKEKKQLEYPGSDIRHIVNVVSDRLQTSRTYPLPVTTTTPAVTVPQPTIMTTPTASGNIDIPPEVFVGGGAFIGIIFVYIAYNQMTRKPSRHRTHHKAHVNTMPDFMFMLA